MVRIASIVAVVTWCPLFQWPPPPGQGNDTVSGVTLGGVFDSQQLAAAIDIIAEANPTLSIEILAATSAGSVGIQELSPADSSRSGTADGNTIGLDPTLDADNLAQVLAHEWHHVRQRNDAPGNEAESELPVSCQEMFAYQAEAAFMCLLMASRASEEPSGIRPFYCVQVRDTTDAWYCSMVSCRAFSPNGQLPPGTNAPAPCYAYCQE